MRISKVAGVVIGGALGISFLALLVAQMIVGEVRGRDYTPSSKPYT